MTLTIKYILIGDPSCGKSSIINQFIYQDFNPAMPPSLGVDCVSKKIIRNGQTIDLKIWDTAGQEKFSIISKNFYRDSAVAILVFDLTSQKSFEGLKKWLAEIRDYGNQKTTLLLAGNKSDLRVEKSVSVSEDQILDFVKENGILTYVECSALRGTNVTDIFECPYDAIIDRIKGEEIDFKLSPMYGIRYQSEVGSENPFRGSGGSSCEL
jgi:small GTP-binding protein